MNLDAYFARIHYEGTKDATLATLHALSLAHVKHIPFENLDVLLGRGISLEPDAVWDKLVVQKRGGYCFEQNTLLLRVLEYMGFDVTPISARVRYQRPRDFLPPRTHVFVKVKLGPETWFADVGVGAMSLTSAIQFALTAEQATSHEPRRIVFEEGRYFHQVRFGSEWHDICEFTLEEMPPIDRELGNWFTSAHPQSHFKNRLLVARAVDDGGRITLLNRDLTFRSRDGQGKTSVIANPGALVSTLAEHFGLGFPEGTEFPCSGLVWT